MDADTDTLLAIVSSLLTAAPPAQSVLLDALVKSNGDPQEAAQLINTSTVKDNRKKRKRVIGDLDHWLAPNPSPKNKSTRKERVSDVDETLVSIPSAHNSPKPAVNLMSLLRQPPKTQSIPRLTPLILSTPSMIAAHTPCTLHLSVLPSELACKLFYTMIDASHGWKRNKWWLVDKLVESPHRTSFYARKEETGEADDGLKEAAQYWYNGRRTDPPLPFPSAMEEACAVVEGIVNEEMRKRERYPLEWGGTDEGGATWRANVAASNCYEGAQESVGFHSDHLTYLGPYPTIASLSLGVQRVFRLREVIPTDETGSRRARTFNLPLPHNSLTIMHASCQERFKHSIPPQPTIDLFRPAHPRSEEETAEPSICRINITFRFYRPDFHPYSIPRCKCGVPTVLRPDMKNRQDGKTDRYWWNCYAGAQNDGKGCNFWKVMDMKAEGRGPVVDPSVL